MRPDRKKLLVLLLILAVAITVAHCSPSYFDTPVDDFQSDLYENESFLPGLSSRDLFHIRGKISHEILPPTDRDKASALLAECETLWNELQQFKDDPEFRQLRFSPGSRFSRWRERAEALHHDRPGKEIVGSDINRLTDAMLGVANDYAGSQDHYSCQEECFINYHLPTAKQSLDESSKNSSTPLESAPCP